ncbi:unnamed protein product [Effrenium voratum]|nr:unnamed protein product [Effrenium voratum]
MVFGTLGAGLMGAAAVGAGNWDMLGMTGGFATSGRGAQVDQAFQRKHDKIDYKVQRQGLHRDDIADLMSMTTGRMDMYNLVGALLLTFALQWITSSDIVVSASADLRYWPPWYSTVFVISCFSSVGYLLFSLWFAMHCSITVQSLGTRLRLNFARLSLPDNKQIKKLRVPFFIPGGALEKLHQKLFEAEAEANTAGSEHPSVDGRPNAVERLPTRMELLAELQQEEERQDSHSDGDRTPTHGFPSGYVGKWYDDESKNDDDKDFEKHLREWIWKRGHWLSYDAYARSCMVVGMNQLLQALTYHVVATVWKVSVITSIACLILSKLLSLFILKIDVEGTRSYTCLGATILMTLELAPPVYSTVMLMIYTPGVEWPGWLEGLHALPVFLCHGLWMLYLAGQLRPADRPLCSKAPGLSDESESEDSTDDPERLSRCRSMIYNGSYGMEHVPRRFQAVKFLDVFRFQNPVPEEEMDQMPWAQVDPTPGKISVNFTLALAAIWVLAGIFHCAGKIWGFDFAAVINCDENNCTTGSGSTAIWPHARPKPHSIKPKSSRVRALMEQTRYANVTAGARRLHSAWPVPASFFQVTGLFCGNASQLFVQNAFDVFATIRDGDRLAELVRLGIPNELSTVFCSERCFSLAPESPGTWSLSLLNDSAPASSSDFARNVTLPSTWRRVSANCVEPCDALWLAGWDGSGIIAAGLQRDRLSGAWHLEQRFKVQPGAGVCHASEQMCERHVAGDYGDVQALQVGFQGRSLTVLHGERWLDFWDLELGAFLGQLDLGVAHRAMCHNGWDLHLARQSPEGPILEVLPLGACVGGTGSSQALR